MFSLKFHCHTFHFCRNFSFFLKSQVTLKVFLTQTKNYCNAVCINIVMYCMHMSFLRCHMFFVPFWTVDASHLYHQYICMKNLLINYPKTVNLLYLYSEVNGFKMRHKDHARSHKNMWFPFTFFCFVDVTLAHFCFDGGKVWGKGWLTVLCWGWEAGCSSAEEVSRMAHNGPLVKSSFVLRG